jgi:hypothetical protein
MPQLNGFEFFNYIKFTVGNYLERPVDDPWGLESLHSVHVNVILLIHVYVNLAVGLALTVNC